MSLLRYANICAETKTVCIHLPEQLTRYLATLRYACIKVRTMCSLRYWSLYKTFQVWLELNTTCRRRTVLKEYQTGIHLQAKTNFNRTSIIQISITLTFDSQASWGLASLSIIILYACLYCLYKSALNYYIKVKASPQVMTSHSSTLYNSV